jgi:hypothetical protein
MDNLKEYYSEIRALEEALPDEDTVVVSLRTRDGGVEGVMSVVTRRIACRMVVEKKARLATEEEKRSYYEAEAARRKEFEEAALANRIQVHVVADGIGREIRGMKPRKK